MNCDDGDICTIDRFVTSTYAAHDVTLAVLVECAAMCQILVMMVINALRTLALRTMDVLTSPFCVMTVIHALLISAMLPLECAKTHRKGFNLDAQFYSQMVRIECGPCVGVTCDSGDPCNPTECEPGRKLTLNVDSHIHRNWKLYSHTSSV